MYGFVCVPANHRTGDWCVFSPSVLGHVKNIKEVYLRAVLVGFAYWR